MKSTLHCYKLAYTGITHVITSALYMRAILIYYYVAASLHNSIL